MFFREHAPHAFDGRNGWSHAGFGVEAVSPAASALVALVWGLHGGSVLLPITRCDVLIWACHFDAAYAGIARQLGGRRGDNRIRPEQFLFDTQISLLDIGRRRVVTAIEPHQQTGMTAQAIDLIAQGLLRNVEILGLPLGPMLPVITAAPAGHDQNSAPISQIEKFFGFELTF